MNSNKTTMLACGVITSAGLHVSRVTPEGWVMHSSATPDGRAVHSLVAPSGRFSHCRVAGPVEHTVHTPMPRLTARLLARARRVFAWTVVIGFLLSLLAEVVERLCAPGPVQ